MSWVLINFTRKRENSRYFTVWSVRSFFSFKKIRDTVWFRVGTLNWGTFCSFMLISSKSRTETCHWNSKKNFLVFYFCSGVRKFEIILTREHQVALIVSMDTFIEQIGFTFGLFWLISKLAPFSTNRKNVGWCLEVKRGSESITRKDSGHYVR